MGNRIADQLSGMSLGAMGGLVRAILTGDPLQIMQSDPRMQKVFDYVNQHGGNPEQALQILAKEKGKDPQEAIAKAQSFLNGLK